MSAFPVSPEKEAQLARRMTALGVRPLLRHLAGELTRDDAVEAGQAETRQYAKRQVTWARSNMMSWKWLSAQETEKPEGILASFVQKAH